MTYSELRPLFLSWLVHYRPLSKSTIEQYNLCLTRIFHDQDLTNIDTISLQDWLIEESELRNYASASRVRLYAAVKMFCRFLFFQRFTVEDVSERIPYPRRESIIRDTIVTDEEIERLLLSKAPLTSKTMIALMFDTGCRVSALLGLKIDDINLEKLTIHVTEKGSKQRELPICAKTGQYVGEYLSIERWKLPGRPWLFCSATGRSLDRGEVGRRIKQACELAGINKNVTPHTLRHSRATSLVKKGVPITHVAALLGHKDIRLTFNRYTHLDAEELRGKIGGYLIELILITITIYDSMMKFGGVG